MTRAVVRGEAPSAVALVRPPGHHARPDQGMGFCIFNNVAVAATHALEVHGLERVAIIDFDVHHGNGTEDIFGGDPRAIMASIFQHPYYPYCGADSGNDHIINVPLPAMTDGRGFRAAVERFWLPALEEHRPQLVFVSAGFQETMSFVHGSQGCVAYYRSHLSRHFKEPCSAVSSSIAASAARPSLAVDSAWPKPVSSSASESARTGSSSTRRIFMGLGSARRCYVQRAAVSADKDQMTKV